jgi:hypothetical protein
MIMRPGRQPLVSIVEILVSLSVRSSEMDTGRGITRGADHVPVNRDAIMARLRIEPGYLGIALRAWARARLRRLVLVVDQFEELYTLGASTEERTCMLACLGSVADDVASPLRVILSMRSDFLDRLAEQRAFLDAVSRGLSFLPPPDRGSLREALTKPVEVSEHRFESPVMVERILDELETTRNALPLLQFTADKLWAGRDRVQRMLTESSLHSLGGVSGALASHANAILASMPAHDARLARTIFLRLVTPERTRAAATMAELRQLGSDAESMDRVLTRLIDARLLAVGSSSGGAADSDGSDGLVEVIHESLIDTWPLLGQWLVENKDDAIFLARLRSAAQEWEKRNRDEGLLWRGEPASEARRWYAHYHATLPQREHNYLRAVLALDTRTTHRRLLLVAGTLLMVLFMAFVWTRSAKGGIREELLRHLGGAVSLKRDSIDQWYQERAMQVSAIPQIPSLEQQALAMADVEFEKRAAHPAYAPMRDHLRLYIEENGFYDEVFLMDVYGRVILSTDSTQEGKFKDNRAYFQEGLKGVCIQNTYHSVTLGRITSTLALPIVRNGRTVAVMAFRLRIQRLHEIIHSYAGLGSESDMYLVDNYNYFVTDPAGKTGFAMERVNYSEPVHRCLTGQTGADEFVSYDGREVLAAFTYLPDYRLCIVAELESATAYQPVRAMQFFAIAVTAPILVIVMLVAFFVSTRSHRFYAAIFKASVNAD